MKDSKYINLNCLAKRREILQPSEASSSLKNIEETILVSTLIIFYVSFPNVELSY